jgi:predicted nucleic acid-binding protein
VKPFVLDASIVLSWFIDRPIAPSANNVQALLLSGNQAVVPPLWRLEIVNAFLVAERRGNLTAADTSQALYRLEILSAKAIETYPEPTSMRRVLALARQFRLTAYDAAYLDIAIELQLGLATLDQQLAAAAARAGISVVR